MSVKNMFMDDDFTFPPISEREIAQERLVYNTTEDILLALQDAGMSQSELSKKLGKSKPYISKLLDGTRNMTLKTLSDIAYALKADVKVTITKNGVDVSHPIVPIMRNNTYISTSSIASNLEQKSSTIVIKPEDMGLVQNVTYRY